MRIAIRGHDVLAAGSLNFALIRSATKAANRAAPAVGGGTAAPAQAAGEVTPGPGSPGPLFSSEEKSLADAEHIANMPKDELVQICTVLGLNTEGDRDDLANRVLAHSDLGAVAAALGPVTPDTFSTRLHDLTVAQLKEFAKSSDIDLGGATLKQEIIDVIEAHSAPK